MKWIIHFLVCLFSIQSVFSQIIEIKNPSEAYSVGKQFFFFEDTSGKLSIKEIQQTQYQTQFIQNKSEFFTNPATSSAFWFRFTVKNQTSQPIWLSIASTFIFYLDLYQETADGKWVQVAQTGVLRADSSRAYPVTHGFWLPLHQDQTTKTYYLRIQQDYPIEFPLTIGTNQALQFEKDLMLGMNAGYLGVMLIMFLYNTFLYFSTKDKLFLLYGIYVIVTSATTTFLNGFPIITSFIKDNEFLYRQFPLWNLLNTAMVVIFCFQYLNVKQNSLFFYRLIQGLFGSYTLAALLLFFGIMSTTIIIEITEIISILIFGVCWWRQFYVWKVNKMKAARYYVWGWFFIFVSVIIFLGVINGFFPYNIFLRNAGTIGDCLETWFFALALGDRYQILRQEKAEIQEENLRLIENQKMDLEEKILERTKEILEKNEELFKLKDNLILTNRIAKVGYWEMNFIQPAFIWSDVTKDIFEVEPEVSPALSTMIELFSEGYNRNTIQKLFQEAQAQGKHFDARLQIRTATGLEKWVRVIGFSEQKNGICMRVYGILQDISIEKEYEDQLITSRTMLQNFFDLTIDFMAIASMDGYFLKVNETFSRVLGYSTEELLTTSFLQMIHPEDIESTQQEMKKLAAGYVTIDFENRFLTKDGKYLWLSWRTAPDPDNNFLIATARDVTERKKSESALLHLKNNLELTSQIAKVGI